MTLVVARVEKGRLAIAADTMLSAHGTSFPMRRWVLKSMCLPGGICVSYSGSPELASKAFQEFRHRYPQGANYALTTAFFEASSAATNNDYIVAFADTAKLVTIHDGRRIEESQKHTGLEISRRTSGFANMSIAAAGSTSRGAQSTPRCSPMR